MFKVSNSKIQTFKNCRRAYELKYVYNLVPVEEATALKVGKDYHSCAEQMLKGKEYECEDPRTIAMAKAFEKYIKPNLPEVAETEKWFEYPAGRGNRVVGRMDGVTKDGYCIEHKTTSSDLGGEYLLQLENDEQVMTYMVATGKNKVYYTVCKKPTIRQKQNETDEEYIDRCDVWYQEDPEHRCGIVEVIRLNDDIENFRLQQIEIIKEMKKAKHFYKVPSMCFRTGRQCEFASICNNYDPQLNYVEFKTREEQTNNEIK